MSDKVEEVVTIDVTWNSDGGNGRWFGDVVDGGNEVVCVEGDVRSGSALVDG